MFASRTWYMRLYPMILKRQGFFFWSITKLHLDKYITFETFRSNSPNMKIKPAAIIKFRFHLEVSGLFFSRYNGFTYDSISFLLSFCRLWTVAFTYLRTISFFTYLHTYFLYAPVYQSDANHRFFYLIFPTPDYRPRKISPPNPWEFPDHCLRAPVLTRQ